MNNGSSQTYKILFFSHYFPPECNAPASRVHEMAKRWIAEGHQVTVLTCVPNAPSGVVYKGYRNKIWQKESIDGIDVIRVWTFIAANKRKIRRILNYVSYMISAVVTSLFVKRPDVVIATSPQFFCGWAGVWFKWLRRVPFILEIRDIWPDSIEAVNAINNHKVIRFLEFLERWMYRVATHIVTVGPGYQRRLIRRGVEPDKISIITNGADTDLFFPRLGDLNIRERYGLQDVFICASVGTLGMASGLHVVIKTAKILKQKSCNHIKFMLIGDGAIRKDLEHLIKQEGLDNIVMTGLLPKEEIPKYLATVDACLVHLKKSDVFKTVLPSKIFEAMAMERTIILGVEGDAEELVKEAKAGICIEPENAEKLAQAILKLASDKKLARQYGLAGGQYVREHYNRASLAQEYLEQIHHIITSYSKKHVPEIVRRPDEVVLDVNDSMLPPKILPSKNVPSTAKQKIIEIGSIKTEVSSNFQEIDTTSE